MSLGIIPSAAWITCTTSHSRPLAEWIVDSTSQSSSSSGGPVAESSSGGQVDETTSPPDPDTGPATACGNGVAEPDEVCYFDAMAIDVGLTPSDVILVDLQGDGALDRARQTIRDLCRKHGVSAIAVGNGTHGRETEAFVKEVLAKEGLTEAFCVPVSESGASVYSASEVAREEFPDLDLTVRGAISIARRLIDAVVNELRQNV